MATGDIKTFDFVYAGLTLKIEAIDLGGGKTTFEVTSLDGSADINALYWNDGDSKANEGNLLGFGAKGDNSLNMNGSGEAWDGGIKLSSTGIGPQGLAKPTYLQTGETYDALGVSVDWNTITHLGVRATSTSTGDGSIKGVDDQGDVILAPKVCVDDAAPVVEGANSAFVIHLDHAYAYDVTVNYTTVGGSATDGTDYVHTAGSVTIAAGDVNAIVDVTTNTDADAEGTETFTLHLTGATADIPGTDIPVAVMCNDGVGTILDSSNDPGPGADQTFGGLSKGFWVNHQAQWDGQHALHASDSAETLFGVNFTGDASDLTLLQAISAGGGGAIALARQATAAIIDAANPEDLGAHAYRFTSAEIIGAVQQAFGLGNSNPDNVYNATMGAELAHVLEFWDQASDDEGTADSHAGADDVKTLLLDNVSSPNVNTDADHVAGLTGTGTMFTASLAGVLHELYPAQWA